jgi:hypothetical protein
MYTRCPPNTQGNFSECFMHREFSEQIEVGVICAICAYLDSFELGWTWCPKCHVFTFLLWPVDFLGNPIMFYFLPMVLSDCFALGNSNCWYCYNILLLLDCFCCCSSNVICYPIARAIVSKTYMYVIKYPHWTDDHSEWIQILRFTKIKCQVWILWLFEACYCLGRYLASALLPQGHCCFLHLVCTTYF